LYEGTDFVRVSRYAELVVCVIDHVLGSYNVRGGAGVPANTEKTGQGEDKAVGLDHYDRVFEVTL
jgi:hypothetical protein